MSEGQYLVGVDIGSSAIKVCHLKEVGGKPTLVRFAYEPLPSQTIVDGHIMGQGVVVEALQRIWTQQKIKRREVALAVSGHSVIIKRITLPHMTPAELAEQITWEAEQQIPFDIKDVQIDYEVLRRRADAGQMDVLLVAAKKDDISETAQIAREAKLKPVVIDVDAFTMQNLFEVNYGLPTEGTFALLNVGASLTTINIIAGGVHAFSRDIANGGNALTEEIQKQLGISFEEAELYKTGGPNGPEPGAVVPIEVPKILKQMMEGIAGQVQQTLDFYLATSGDREVKKIFLAGGTSNVGELGQAISRRSHTEVELFNPFREIAVDTKEVDANLLRLRAAQATVALGLSLRRDREKR